MQMNAAKRGERERRATGRRHHLPALLEPEEHRARVADHGRGSCENTDQRAARPQPERRGCEALREIEQSATGTPSDRPYTRKTFDAPTFPLPFVRMSSPRTSRGTQ